MKKLSDYAFFAPPKEELEKEKEEKRENAKQSRLAKASFAWTIISVLYAIISGAILVSNNWILAPYSYIMAGMLAVYVVLFVVLIAAYADDAKKGKKKIKTFKKLFGMFRIFTNIIFLVATAVSMAGVVDAKGTGLWQWLVLGANILVAAVQLSLKLSLFIMGIVFKRVGKKYTVKAQTYINGVLKEQKTKSAVMSKVYGTDVTEASAEQAVASKTPVSAEQPKPEKVRLDKEQMRAFAAKAAERASAKTGGIRKGKGGEKE